MFSYQVITWQAVKYQQMVVCMNELIKSICLLRMSLCTHMKSVLLHSCWMVVDTAYIMF